MKKLLITALVFAVIGCGQKDTTADQTETTTTTTTTAEPSVSTPTVPGPTATTAPAATPSTPQNPQLPPGMPPVNPQASSLIVTNSSYTLTPGKRTDSSIVELSCGCHFNFIVERFTGDTNVIKFKQFDAKTAQSHKVGVQFTGDAKARKGMHQVKLAFLSTGSKGDYRDTITVKYQL